MTSCSLVFASTSTPLAGKARSHGREDRRPGVTRGQGRLEVRDRRAVHDVHLVLDGAGGGAVADPEEAGLGEGVRRARGGPRRPSPSAWCRPRGSRPRSRSRSRPLRPSMSKTASSSPSRVPQSASAGKMWVLEWMCCWPSGPNRWATFSCPWAVSTRWVPARIHCPRSFASWRKSATYWSVKSAIRVSWETSCEDHSGSTVKSASVKSSGSTTRRAPRASSRSERTWTANASKESTGRISNWAAATESVRGMGVPLGAVVEGWVGGYWASRPPSMASSLPVT